MEMVMKRMAIKKMVKPWTFKTLDLLVLFSFSMKLDLHLLPKKQLLYLS